MVREGAFLLTAAVAREHDVRVRAEVLVKRSIALASAEGFENSTIRAVQCVYRNVHGSDVGEGYEEGRKRDDGRRLGVINVGVDAGDRHEQRVGVHVADQAAVGPWNDRYEGHGDGGAAALLALGARRSDQTDECGRVAKRHTPASPLCLVNADGGFGGRRGQLLHHS